MLVCLLDFRNVSKCRIEKKSNSSHFDNSRNYDRNRPKSMKIILCTILPIAGPINCFILLMKLNLREYSLPLLLIKNNVKAAEICLLPFNLECVRHKYVTK